MIKTIFVTGTDTGVGKTTVTSAMVAFLSLRRKLNVGVMKPFESGLSKGDKDLLPWDAICLREASGSTDDLDLISPYTFEAPLAPEVAARLENVTIDLNVVDRIYRNIQAHHDLVVIEGAGGIMVPIKKKFFYIDLILRWGAPTLIVSRLGLGTINHTLLTVNLLKEKGVKILGVVLNNTGGLSDVAARTNPDVLKEYLDVPVLGIFPHVKDLLKGNVDRERMAELFEKNINADPLLEE